MLLAPLTGRRVVPELIQSDFTADKVAGETIRLLQDANARRADEHRQTRELENGEDVLCHCSWANADVVDAGKKDDRRDRQGHREAVRQPQQRQRVVGERHRHGGNGAGRNDEDESPAVQKSGQRPERLTEVHVPPTRARAALAELPEAERADQRHDAADHPGQQHEARRVQPLSDGRGRAEDPAPDDPTYDGHRSRKQPETSRVGCHGGVWRLLVLTATFVLPP